ncbi:MAG: universal stress protein [Gemmatimonadota bacterium]
MIRRILVPLDGSAIAERALDHAVAVGKALGADAILARVVDPGRIGGLTRDAVEWRLQHAESVSYLEAQALRVRAAGLAIEVEVLEGRAAEKIVDVARARQVDLIVLSRHGQNGAMDFVLGGTAQKVISGAGVSILLVRDGEAKRSAGEGAPYGRIMVPCDCSPRGEWALCLAAALARAHGAELYVVHVIPKPQTPDRLPAGGAERDLRRALLGASRRSARRYVQAMERKLAAPDLRIRTEFVASSQVPRALHEKAMKEGVDLLVVSAHGASGPSPWPYGSVTCNLLHYSRVPVLVLQDLPLRPPVTAREESHHSLALAGNGAGP